MFRQVRRDLAWFPGRPETSWRVAALCTLMAFIAMLYGIPESAISCYLILFVMKPDPVESMVMAIAVSILVTLVVGTMILLLPWALESAPLRLAVLVVSSFAFLWLGSASKLGPVGSIIALVIAFVMSLLGNAPSGELATRAVLYAWLMAVTPMLLLVVFNLFLGRSSLKILRSTLSERLLATAAVLRHPDDVSLQTLRAQLLEGQSEHQQRALLIRLFHLCPAAEAAWLTAAVQHSYRLLLAVADRSQSRPALLDQALADECEAAALAIEQKRLPAELVIENAGIIGNVLMALSRGDVLREVPSAKSSFFVGNAFSSPVHTYFALKTTAASVICYLTYTALDWQDIHTAMITCYVAALGTTGETVHKLTLRIVGCLIGAAIGLISLLLIIPWLSDIGQLMALIFIVILPAAWVSSGNERIAYAGIQIGLAFLLTVLHGFAPATDMDVAVDRIIGILLGNIVVYLLFTRLWPAAIADAVRTRIHNALHGLARLAAAPGAGAAALREAAILEETLSSAYESLKLLPFEPASLRPGTEEIARLQAILTEIEVMCPALFVPGNATGADSQRLDQMSANAADSSLAPGMPRQASMPEDNTIRHHISRLEELLG
nr:FUSC family protein [Klebsiella oxytoca]